MATVTISNHYVNPTENDVNGGTSGAGRIPTEDSLAKLWRYPGGLAGYVASGFTAPTTGTSNRTQNITGGVAHVDGHVVSGSGTTSVTFAASATEYWWLQLVYTSSKVTSVQLASTTSATSYLANAIPLWVVTCNSTDVTAVTDRRPGGRRIFGSVANAATISDHGSGFWSVASGGTGVATITFPAGVFIRAPIVMTTPLDSSVDVVPSSITTTGCTITTYVSGTPTASKSFAFTAIL